MTPAARAAAASVLLSLPLPAQAFSMTDAFLDAVAAGAYRTVPAAEPPAEGLVRIAPADAGPGGAPGGADRPSPRVVSNALSIPELRRNDATPVSNLAVGWAQFMMSHDLARSPTDGGPDGVLDIPVAADDPVAQDAGGVPVMRQRRSARDPLTGEPFSDVTPWLDASTVYGSTAGRLAKLRAPGEDGMLRTAADGGLMIVDGRRYAGDDRADENIVLQSIHELLMKEHNRLAGEIAAGCEAGGRDCSGDDVFGGARAVNAFVQQRILYEEFVPAFLGAASLEALVPDAGLLDGPGIVLNEFTAAAGRIGHTKVPPRVEAALPGGPRTGEAIEACIFSATCLADQPLGARLYGAATQAAEPVDTVVADGLRDALLEAAGGEVLIDLLATNVNRGRDHGLAGYLATRRALGFPDLPLEALMPEEVTRLYAGAADVDLLVGLFAEEALPGSQLGETGSAIWALQLGRLSRDPGFYAGKGADPIAGMLGDWGLADVIAANTVLAAADVADPFMAPVPIPLPSGLAGAGLGLAMLAALRRRTGGRARAADGFRGAGRLA